MGRSSKGLRTTSIAALRATWKTVRTHWVSFLLTNVALAVGVWVVQKRPEPTLWQGVKAILIAGAILAACAYVAHLVVHPIVGRLRFETEKRRAYRKLLSVDPRVSEAVKDAVATSFQYNGVEITARTVFLFIAERADSATYQAIENHLVGKCKPKTPEENNLVTGSAANLFLALKHRDMLQCHKDDESGNAGPYLMDSQAVVLVENLRAGELLQKYGPARWWT